MALGDDDVEEVVALVARDLETTLGWSAGRARAVAGRWVYDLATDPQSGVDSAEELGLRAAEGLQEWLHEDLRETTWPACPRHRRHPLWLGVGDDPVTWCCPADGTAVARLGELPRRLDGL